MINKKSISKENKMLYIKKEHEKRITYKDKNNFVPII